MKQTSLHRMMYALAALVFALLLWSYGNTLYAMASKWWTDPQYSQGYLIPVIALVLLYLRRDALRQSISAPDPRGLFLLGIGLGVHVLSGRLYVDFIDALSFLPAVAGLIWVVGGWPLLRGSWPAILFLVFMIPLPYSVEASISLPLQRLATLGSTYLLQTLGFPAIAEGNIIIMSTSRIGVVEACSGLSMLLVVVALATAFAIITRPPWPDRIVLVGSALPVAVLVNVLRITATGIAQEMWGTAVAEEVVHDWAGWLMMPVVCGLIALEVWLLRVLFPVKDLRPLHGDQDHFMTKEEPALDEPSTPKRRAVLVGLAAGLIVSAGFANGILSDRWGDSSDLVAAVDRLERVSTKIGNWVGQPIPVDTRALQLSEVSGYISRNYVHAATGDQVSVLIICGRTGPVSVHTPDICYLGAGYHMGPRSVESLPGVEPSAAADFWSAFFSKPRDPVPLHILWSWSDGDGWHAPTYPRLTFLRSKVLYKLYVIHPARARQSSTTDESLRGFVKDLLPELQRTLLTGNEP